MPAPTKKTPPPLADNDDLALFRAQLGDVRRLQTSDRARPERRAPDPTPAQRLADEQQVLHELLDDPDPDWIETGDELIYRAPGVQLRVLRKLRRGEYVVGDSLDLHGLNAAQARAQVMDFLNAARDRDQRSVKIIHGKGLRSSHAGPVLKRKLGGWLRKRRDVLAFGSAPPHDGGTGAVYVLLRRVPG